MSGLAIIDIILIILCIVSIITIYNMYKTRKLNDGKLDLTEVLEILLQLNAEVKMVLVTIEESKLHNKLTTLEEQRTFVANKLSYLIQISSISEEDKIMLLDFGTDKIAKLIIKKVK